MHVYFSGIGGTAIGPLAQIAKQAGFEVSGSDASESIYTDYLKKHGISGIHIGQSAAQIKAVHSKKPIDWFVYSSALPKTRPDHPELVFCEQNGIKTSLRDEFLSNLISDKKLKLVAIAGTHGKTTTTAMAVWLFKEFGEPVSYSVGAKISFGEMGQYDPGSRYFIYEADEYDRNFLSFYPEMSLITGVDWDHPDIYPTRESYTDAFKEFIGQSKYTVLWHDDAEQLGQQAGENLRTIDRQDARIDRSVTLPGRVNREDAWLVANSLSGILDHEATELANKLSSFPGVSRRFEKIAPGVHSDYAHTPPKIRGALQLAQEMVDKLGKNNGRAGSAGRQAATRKPGVVVVYEGLHNTRQHFIKNELKALFDDVKQLYIVPSYLAREDKELELLSPEKLLNLLSNKSRSHAAAARLDEKLLALINKHAAQGDLVLCLSAGGAGSLDEWLRKNY